MASIGQALATLTATRLEKDRPSMPSHSLFRRREAIAAAAVVASLTSATLLFADPTITSLDAATATRSGRIIIRGSGFGARDLGGFVEIGGVRAHTARWSDTQISAYVPESLPLGPAQLRVTIGPATSADTPITIAARPTPTSHLAWQFKVDAPGIRHRGAVATDGTIYVNDTLGFLYALSPEGALRWIYCADCVIGTGSEGPVAISADGTVFVGGNPLGPDTRLHAVNPDGTQRWIHTQTWGDLVAGPSIGPDSRVYICTELSGLGLTALDPASGEVAWAAKPDDSFMERGQVGAEIAFGRSMSGGELNRAYVMFDQRPFQVPIPQNIEGTLFSYSLSG